MRIIGEVNSACLLLVLLVALGGCNLTYKVRNQYHEIEEIVYLPCGKITVELIGKGDSRFWFRQQFDIDQVATIYPDSLKIFFNSKNVVARSDQENVRGVSSKKEFLSNEVWETSFELEGGVFDGDTIKIFGPDYVNCGGESVTLDTMVYMFINSLRIYGVNER